MSMIEKFVKRKEIMDKNADAIHEEFIKLRNDKLDAEIGAFMKDFEQIVCEASDDEFDAFMNCENEAIDVEDKIAAIACRTERLGKVHTNDAVAKVIVVKLR